MAGRAESQAINIDRNYSQQVPEIRTGNLFQVFCNLIKNAFDAMGDGGQLSISTSLSGGNNDIAVVEFVDSGSGFDVADSAVIFEPFYTTKAKGEGTGLGLAICKDIVERAGGRITAECSPTGGSVFTVFLPLTDQVQGDF